MPDFNKLPCLLRSQWDNGRPLITTFNRDFPTPSFLQTCCLTAAAAVLGEGLSKPPLKMDPYGADSPAPLNCM